MQMDEGCLVDEKGNRVAVVLPIAEYDQMLEDLEELEDIRAFDEAKAYSH
jgi:PHD/YefM family antitoxin component YafN of YafNO toxin-antitoxin module